MSVKLYKLNYSAPSRAVLMIANIIKLDLITEDVDTLKGDQFKPEFLKKNPLHTVPVMEEDDLILADSHCIITYLVSKYGGEKQAELYPTALKTRAIIDERLLFDTGYASARMVNAAYTFIRDKKPLSTAQIASIEEVYGYLEKYLEASRFLAANHITVADVSLVSTVSSMDAMVPIDHKFVKLIEWFEFLKKQEWYQAVNAPGLARFVQIIKGN